MKKNIYAILIVMWVGFTFSACSEDSLSDTSVVIDSTNEDSQFDRWLDTHFRSNYNIQFKYKYEDIESDLEYDLVPADIEQSKILAKMVKYLWLEPYTEVGGISFLRSYAPRVLHVIGTVGWNPTQGTFTMGTAEGGLKITLYAGNWLADFFQIVYDNVDPTKYTIEMNKDQVNYYYLHVLHHEFAHILHQTKDYPAEFKLISVGDYVAAWHNVPEETSLRNGFITSYASSEFNEDFVETFASYLTLSHAQWAAKMRTAGTEGAAKINLKLQYVREYMKNTWDIDLDFLKEVVDRRFDEVYELDWINF